MTRTIEDIIGNGNAFEVLNSLNRHLSTSSPDGKLVHKIAGLKSAAIECALILEIKDLKDITFSELKENYPSYYKNFVSHIKRGIKDYGFKV